MKHHSFLIICLVCLSTFTVNAQTYSILIKGGTVIDPKNNINQLMDVGIFEGKIKLEFPIGAFFGKIEFFFGKIELFLEKQSFFWKNTVFLGKKKLL